ncbi:hypothetical protein Q1695_013840 [Nippostrongylus brasiliensis]|nr:hypothetical protein Q1695_013840 [Nippostrongylus brasiliensis]
MRTICDTGDYSRKKVEEQMPTEAVRFEKNDTLCQSRPGVLHKERQRRRRTGRVCREIRRNSRKLLKMTRLHPQLTRSRASQLEATLSLAIVHNDEENRMKR